jgi:hypothetical protein
VCDVEPRNGYSEDLVRRFRDIPLHGLFVGIAKNGRHGGSLGVPRHERGISGRGTGGTNDFFLYYVLRIHRMRIGGCLNENGRALVCQARMLINCGDHGVIGEAGK